MSIGHIGGTAQRPIRAKSQPVPEPTPDDIEEIAESDDEPDLYAGLGTCGTMSLFKPREQILREWQILGDQILVDRGWGAQPVPDGAASIAPEYVNAALDPYLGIPDVIELAQRERLIAYCGVDTASSTKRTADNTALVTLFANRKTRHVYVVDLRYEHGANLPRQIKLVHEVNRAFAPKFRIEGNAQGLANAEHLASEVAQGTAFASTARNKWSQQIGVPAMVHWFASRLVTIPGNARGRHLFDPLVRELRSFPHGRHDDAVDAFRFALAAFILDTATTTKRPGIGHVDIPSWRRP